MRARPAGHRLIAGVLLGVTSLLAAVVIWIAASTWGAQARPQGSSTLTSATTVEQRFLPGELINGVPDSSGTTVLVHIRRVSLSEHVAHAVVEWNLPGGEYSLQSVDGAPIHSFGDPPYSKMPLTLETTQSTAEGTHSLTTNLGDLVPAIDRRGILPDPFSYPQALDLAIDGTPGAYPEDVYGVDLTMRLVMPQGITRSVGQDASMLLPISAVIVTQDDGIGDYSVAYQRLYGGAQVATRVEIHRAPRFVAYIFAIAFAPLIMIAMLTHIVARRLADLSVVLTLVFGALFTILPLRAVLVPPEISGVTRVDLALGCQLVLLLWVGVYAYFGTAGTQRVSRRAHQADDQSPSH